MIKTHFVFAVSFVAMMAVGSALAYNPATTDDTTDTIATEHLVYNAQTPTDKDSGAGIAGVSYVNRAVNMAGASAQAAEAHAAAAGQAALDAAASAKSANEALEDYATKTYVDDEIAAFDGGIGTELDNLSNAKQAKSTAAYQMGNASGGWTTMTQAQQDALNSGVTSTTVTQVATNKTNIATNTTNIGKKQDTLVPDTNIKGSGSVTVTKGADGVITISGTDADTTYGTGTADTAGLTKLYSSTGSSTDGTMTRDAITSALENKADKTELDAYATKTYVDDEIAAFDGGIGAELDNLSNAKQDKSTAVTHTASTAAGTTTRPVYVTTAGVATEVSGISVPVKSGTSTTSWAEIWVE